MNSLDDRPLVRTPEADDVSEPAPRRAGAGFMITAAAVGLLLGGFAAWWWASEQPLSDRAATIAAGSEGALERPAEASRPLPPLGQMDTFLRALLGALSSNPELARWLATDDLIRQMAHVIDRISRGASPARDLPVMAPRGTFDVVHRQRSTVIDTASYHRYDGLAAAVASLDAQAVADAYNRIRPRLDEAYRGLGRTEERVDRAVTVALDVLLETPSVNDSIPLVPGRGATYAFADPRLEALAPVQKQLLRMGPDNVMRIQTRLREIAEAIAALPGP